MLYSGAKGTMTPNHRLQRTALPRRGRTGTLTAAKGRFRTLRLTALGGASSTNNNDRLLAVNKSGRPASVGQ